MIRTTWAFATLCGALLIGSALDAPSAHQEAMDVAARVADLERDSAEIAATVAGMDRAIEREARALCKRTHGVSAVHWWTADNKLRCSRNARLGAVDRAADLGGKP